MLFCFFFFFSFPIHFNEFWFMGRAVCVPVQ